MVVVLPEPLTPTTRMTNGLAPSTDRERLRHRRQHLLDFRGDAPPSPRPARSPCRSGPRPPRRRSAPRHRRRDRRGSAPPRSRRAWPASSLRLATRSEIAPPMRRGGALEPAAQALPPTSALCLCCRSSGARDSGFRMNTGRDGGAPALSRRPDAGDRQAGRASRCTAGRRAARAWRTISTRCASGCRARPRSRTGSTATPPAAWCSAATARRWPTLGRLFKSGQGRQDLLGGGRRRPRAEDEGRIDMPLGATRRDARLVDEARSAGPAGG